MKVLIDTCVVVDLLQNRQDFVDDAKDIFLFAFDKQIDACLTAKAITDIYYLCHKFTHSDEKTREILGKLFVIFTIEDSLGEDCKNALLSHVSDYEDAVMSETAKRSNVDYIVTRNLKDFKKSGVKVLTPGAFVAMVKNNGKL